MFIKCKVKVRAYFEELKKSALEVLCLVSSTGELYAPVDLICKKMDAKKSRSVSVLHFSAL